MLTAGITLLVPLIGGIVAARIGIRATFWAMPLALIALYLGRLAVAAGRHGAGRPSLAPAPDLG